ncbi:MAG: DUF503 domain-containing protein [Desulfobacteraceae bacterium]|nr:MAG: DUF503 domain-containing protein [Desulfobacteraceae bacterium]
MVIGAGKLTFKLFDVHSLKQKRSIVKSIIHRIKNAFNISISEVDLNDRHTLAVIGFSITGNDVKVVNSKLDKVLNMAEDLGLAMVMDSQIEIIHF